MTPSEKKRHHREKRVAGWSPFPNAPAAPLLPAKPGYASPTVVTQSKYGQRPRIKIITPWYGKLPTFFGEFRKRLLANETVVHELIPIRSGVELTAKASRIAGRRCVKATDYAACCDLKPLFGEMFADRFRGYEWWGRCDLDVVFGDLDRLLAPILDSYDCYNSEPAVMSGAFWMFRNNMKTATLWRSADWRRMFDDPGYTQFDHTSGQYDPVGGFTGAVLRSGLRTYWDERTWDEGREMTADGKPSRVPTLRGKSLVEEPTGRELVLYSLGSRRWPL